MWSAGAGRGCLATGSVGFAAKQGCPPRPEGQITPPPYEGDAVAREFLLCPQPLSFASGFQPTASGTGRGVWGETACGLRRSESPCGVLCLLPAPGFSCQVKDISVPPLLSRPKGPAWSHAVALRKAGGGCHTPSSPLCNCMGHLRSCLAPGSHISRMATGGPVPPEQGNGHSVAVGMHVYMNQTRLGGLCHGWSCEVCSAVREEAGGG